MTMLSTGMELTGTLRKASTGAVLLALIGATFSPWRHRNTHAFRNRLSVEEPVCKWTCGNVPPVRKHATPRRTPVGSPTAIRGCRMETRGSALAGTAGPDIRIPTFPTARSECRMSAPSRKVPPPMVRPRQSFVRRWKRPEIAPMSLPSRNRGDVWRTVLPGELGRSLGAIADGSRALAGNTTFRISSFKKGGCQPAKPKGSFHCSYGVLLVSTNPVGVLAESFKMPMAGTASARLVRSGNT